MRQQLFKVRPAEHDEVVDGRRRDESCYGAERFRADGSNNRCYTSLGKRTWQFPDLGNVTHQRTWAREPRGILLPMQGPCPLP